MKTFISAISGKSYPIDELVHAGTIRTSILKLIQTEHPGFTENDTLAQHELNHYRERYIEQFIRNDIKELNHLNRHVLNALRNESTLTDALERESESPLNAGQRWADRVANFGGSWTFIISFAGFLILWILTNVLFLTHKAFDPYPFILLNLILSCLAAIQAPIIMMSQNRQEEKDRERAKNDYMINLKSELEIRLLHEKVDHMLIRQQQDFLEIQKVQIEMMRAIYQKIETLQKHQSSKNS